MNGEEVNGEFLRGKGKVQRDLEDVGVHHGLQICAIGFFTPKKTFRILIQKKNQL